MIPDNFRPKLIVKRITSIQENDKDIYITCTRIYIILRWYPSKNIKFWILFKKLGFTERINIFYISFIVFMCIKTTKKILVKNSKSTTKRSVFQNIGITGVRFRGCGCMKFRTFSCICFSTNKFIRLRSRTINDECDRRGNWSLTSVQVRNNKKKYMGNIHCKIISDKWLRFNKTSDRNKVWNFILIKNCTSKFDITPNFYINITYNFYPTSC